MNPLLAVRVFVILQLLAMAQLWCALRELPAVVATHFDLSGLPNGYMSHTGYGIFMLIFSVVLPVGLVLFLLGMLRRAKTRINIPHKDYWLSSARQSQTLEFLRGHMILFGVLITMLVCYVQWLVVAAHRVQPVKLANDALLAGLGVFVCLLLVWGLYPAIKFRRIS